MGQELVIPDSFKTMQPADAFKALNPADDNLSEGIGQSYGIIGYKGKVWSLRLRGQRHNIVRPDDGTPSSFLDVIILGQAKQKSKSYYKAYDPNDSGDRPICSSIDGVVPDPDVTQKQCDNCALCPRNEWKTNAQTGKKGRECTDYKRLAVLILPTQTKPILGGVPLMEPVFLRVPPASLNSLAIMGDTMAGQGFHFSTYITRIEFDPNEAHPKMVFRPLQGLSNNEAPVILKLRADPTVNRIVTGDVVIPAVALPPPTQATGIAPQPTTTAPAATTTPAPSAPVASAQPVTTSGLNGSATTVSTSAPATSPASPPAAQKVVEEAFGGVIDAGLGDPAPTSGVIATQQTAADTGPAEESDDDLDARIAGLIKTQ